MSSCPYCSTYGPNTHSFKLIANTPKYGRVFYTCVAKAEDFSNTKAIITHLKAELGEPGETLQPWSWIFDCKDLKMKHTLQIDVAISIAKLLRDNYNNKLVMTFIINPTPGIDTLVSKVVPLFNKDSIHYVRKVPGTLLELYNNLQKEGVEETAIQAIIKETRT
jgi:hypothetical protein